MPISQCQWMSPWSQWTFPKCCAPFLNASKCLSGLSALFLNARGNLARPSEHFPMPCPISQCQRTSPQPQCPFPCCQKKSQSHPTLVPLFTVPAEKNPVPVPFFSVSENVSPVAVNISQCQWPFSLWAYLSLCPPWWSAVSVRHPPAWCEDYPLLCLPTVRFSGKTACTW